MSNITINNHIINRISYRGIPVITFSQIDKVHEKKGDSSRLSFNRNKNRFNLGVDYFVTNSNEAKELGFIAPNGLTLLKEKGYLKIAKTFNDDLAWEVQDLLIDSYFKIKEQNRAAINWNNQDLSKLLITAGQELEKKNLIIKTLQPKADFYDTVTQSDEWLEMADVAKLLGGIGRNKIFELLRQKKVIIEHTTKPYQQFVDRGYFKLVETNYSNSITGEVRVGVKTVVSQRGLDFIRRLLQREEALEGD